MISKSAAVCSTIIVILGVASFFAVLSQRMHARETALLEIVKGIVVAQKGGEVPSESLQIPYSGTNAPLRRLQVEKGDVTEVKSIVLTDVWFKELVYADSVVVRRGATYKERYQVSFGILKSAQSDLLREVPAVD